jgi:hypothetical protein
MSQQAFKTNNKPKRKKWILYTTIIIVLGLGLYFRQDIVIIYQVLTYKPVKPGDKLYATDEFITNQSGTSMITYRIIRPLTLNEIDSLPVNDQKKLELKKMFDPTAGLKSIVAEPAILNDSLKKYKTAYLGECIKVIDTKDKGLYQIKLDPRLIVKKYFPPDPLPPNYTYAGDYYCIGGAFSTREKSSIFP